MGLWTAGSGSVHGARKTWLDDGRTATIRRRVRVGASGKDQSRKPLTVEAIGAGYFAAAGASATAASAVNERNVSVS